jgi:hypothetical protein
VAAQNSSAGEDEATSIEVIRRQTGRGSGQGRPEALSNLPILSGLPHDRCADEVSVCVHALQVHAIALVLQLVEERVRQGVVQRALCDHGAQDLVLLYEDDARCAVRVDRAQVRGVHHREQVTGPLQLRGEEATRVGGLGCAVKVVTAAIQESQSH